MVARVVAILRRSELIGLKQSRLKTNLIVLLVTSIDFCSQLSLYHLSIIAGYSSFLQDLGKVKKYYRIVLRLRDGTLPLQIK